MQNSVAPALAGGEELARGLNRYKRRHKRQLRTQNRLLEDYATGRRFNVMERQLFKAATRSPRLAASFEVFGTRHVTPERFLPTVLPRVLATNIRHTLSGRGTAPVPQPSSSSA